MAIDNKSLGKFILDGIAPASRGVPQVEVTFDIDSNGILNVKAIDKGTGKEQHITITGSSNMSDEDIAKMKEEAEKYAEEDKKKKEGIETHNKAESLVFQSEKALKDAGDKVSDDIKKPVQEKIDAVKKLLENKDASDEDLGKATEELSAEIQKIGGELYKNAQEDAGTPPVDDDGVKVYKEGEKPEEKEEVVEAEVVDKKEKKEKKKD